MRAMCLTHAVGKDAPLWLNPLAIESFGPNKFDSDGKAVGTCIVTRGNDEDSCYQVKEPPEDVAEMFEKAMSETPPILVMGRDTPVEVAMEIAEALKAMKKGGEP